MSKMKLYFYKVFTLLAVLAVSFPAAAENFRVMWYNDNYPPISFVSGDQKVGIIDDLLTAINGLTGDTFTYVEVPFPRAMVMFEAGEIDIEPSVNPSWREDLNQSVYTIPYRRTCDSILFANDTSVVEVRTPDDLIGKRIGVVKGYVYPGYDEYLASHALQTFTSRSEEKLLEKLQMNRVDAVFIHKPYAQYMIKHNSAYRDFVFGAQLYEVDIMMRFNRVKKDAVPRFNKALKQLKDSGELERIYDKYR